MGAGMDWMCGRGRPHDSRSGDRRYTALPLKSSTPDCVRMVGHWEVICARHDN
jgi:hypothetical protein